MDVPIQVLNDSSDIKLGITGQSIRNELLSYKEKPYDAISEYIWNAFDAGATKVSLNFKLPEERLGYVQDLEIIDNGFGWNFQKSDTGTFLASQKAELKKKYKSLPRGKLGRGRYVFIWFCSSLEAYSNKKTLKLLSDDISMTIEDAIDAPAKGTKIVLSGLREIMSKVLIETESLKDYLILEYCWFLKENKGFAIEINGEPIDLTTNIQKEARLTKNSFGPEIHKYLEENFQIDIVLWKNKPKEYSKYYYIDPSTQYEITARTTSLNNKSDDYWHSVYIRSSLFKENDESLDDESIQPSLLAEDKEIKKIKKDILLEIRKQLIKLRKPLLVEKAQEIISDLKKREVFPKLEEFGIYDTESYELLLKTVYVIAPSLLTNRNDKEIAFICATFAGLLSNQDSNLIKLVLQQLQELSEDEKHDLEDILSRTSLSNVVKTIKEIDMRLQVISDLEKLLFDYKNVTLEVKHLQKVLNLNPWVFGEAFRLFRNTEGALHKTLFDYAKSILAINNPEIITDSRKEVDLFLVKTNQESEHVQRNIIVEIKRPSVILGQKECDQIKKYARTIMKEPTCNGENAYWEYYLIGDTYDDYVSDEIKTSSSHGEEAKGLIYNPDKGKVKIYVRKWSDILITEWGYKMKYLRDKLSISEKHNISSKPQDIVINYDPAKSPQKADEE